MMPAECVPKGEQSPAEPTSEYERGFLAAIVECAKACEEQIVPRYRAGGDAIEAANYAFRAAAGAIRALSPLSESQQPRSGDLSGDECHKLDTDSRVFFYEQDFYVLSNFSAFTLRWKGLRFDTSEAAYHWEKFPDMVSIRQSIVTADSAHEAFKIAETWKHARRPDWDAAKVGIMRDILRAKACQHEYVCRKLLATGERELIEDSWRDNFWGWGPNRDGNNMLGKLWMEVRAELRSAPPPTDGDAS